MQKCELDRPVILALPRGGVPVAFEIARELDADLDIIVVRKLGAPSQPELAIGAIAFGGVRVLNEDIIGMLPGLDEQTIDDIAEREAAELARRERIYRGERPFPALINRDVVLVDDGMATGATMRAAAMAVRTFKPAKTVVAVPVAAPDAVRDLAAIVDDVVCLDTPSPFAAIGYFYRNFAQTSDEEVRDLLTDAQAARANQ
jgi:putative phosphoribosyl transferase